MDGKYPVSPPVQTGYPFVVLGPDFSNTSSASPRPNRICSGDRREKSNQLVQHSCFPLQARPQTPTFGNSRRNILDAPGQVNTDLAVMRHFNVWDKADIEFRGEFFKMFNHPFFGAPANNINNPTMAEDHQRHRWPTDPARTEDHFLIIGKSVRRGARQTRALRHLA